MGAEMLSRGGGGAELLSVIESCRAGGAGKGC